MRKRLREFFESIAYAGLKPGAQRPQAAQATWLGRLATRAGRMISGRAPSDPLYLTNRTFGQRARFWAVLIVPCLVLAAAIGIALTNILEPPEPKPAAEPTAGEVAAKTLPNIDNNLKLDRSTDIDVAEMRIVHAGGAHLEGVVRNTTTHDIASATVVVELTDSAGSQVGRANIRIEKIGALQSKSFMEPIRPAKAEIALVREVSIGK
jgi:hypothetical protein